MPTYDYVCDSCGHQFEAFESIKADPQTDCPSCEAKSLRRRIGPGAAILFKGSGFYQTDYRSESYKQRAKQDSAPASGGSGDGAKSSSSDGGGASTSAGKAESTKPSGTGTGS